MNWDEILLEPIGAFFGQLGGFLPNLLAALAILIVGWIVAKVIQAVFVRLLKAVKADSLAEKIKLSEMLAKGGVERTFSQLVGVVLYWVILLVVMVAALNALQLTAAAELLQRLVAFVPDVVAAVFILILGILAAGFLAATIRTVASNAGIAQAQLLGQLVQTIVIIFSVVVALQQLQIQFVGNAFLVILGALSFGAALAFGLGCKDLAGRWVSGLVDRLSPPRA